MLHNGIAHCVDFARAEQSPRILRVVPARCVQLADLVQSTHAAHRSRIERKVRARCTELARTAQSTLILRRVCMRCIEIMCTLQHMIGPMQAAEGVVASQTTERQEGSLAGGGVFRCLPANGY